MRRIAAATALTLLALSMPRSVPADDQQAEEASIRAAVASYVDAFNRGDAKTLAAMWAPDGVYQNPRTGDQIAGRAAIEEQFSAMFAGTKGMKLEAHTESVRFISPSVAVENGTASLIQADQSPQQSSYTAVYVKRDGKWLLDRVSEEDIPISTSNYDHLTELEWMIGTWVDQDEQSRIETTCHWTKNRNFMCRMYSVSVRDRIEMAGMQIVGWDPARKQIRSWVFDSDGGFGHGVWKKSDNAWHIQQLGTLSDGSTSSSTSIIKYVNDDTFTWQSINRVAAGELLPNVDEVVVVRQDSQH